MGFASTLNPWDLFCGDYTPFFYQKEYVRMDELTPKDTWNFGDVFNFLKLRFELAKVPFPKVDCFNDMPETEIELPPNESELKDNSPEVRKLIISASRNFLKHKFSLKELELLGSFRSNIYRWVYFEPEFSSEQTDKIHRQIDTYIDQFLNGELYVYNRNYLTFEKQKQAFIDLVKEMSALEDYGENFIITSEEPDSPSRGDGFLFVHTLYALRKLGYIAVLRLWCDRDNLSDKRIYHANVVAHQSFIDEIVHNFRRENPSMTYGGFDEKNNILKFTGHEIELSRNKKETDAVLLIKAIKDTPDRFWFEDEILEVWGYKLDDETAKNKVYFAARKINEMVNTKTGIGDLIDHNTTKFRINPKYLKVDE